MKKKIITITAIFGLAVLLMSYDNGIAGYNAGPSQSTCNASGCHTGNALNAAGGTMTITDNIPSNGYVPGTTYTVNVTITRTGSSLFGFGFEAANSSSGQAGVLQNLTSSTTTMTSTRQNITHSFNGGLGSGTKTFSFLWTAPSATAGNVTFYSAGNASNGNGSTSGDYIYTTTRTITPTPLSTNSILTNPICAGATSLSIPFTTGSAFNSGNVFTAELSDAVGNFTLPLALGSLTATSSGTIISTVPLPSTAGTGYRIRVVSSNPTYTGIVSASILTLNLSPGTALAGANQSVCGTTATLAANSATNGTGTWSVISGSAVLSSSTNPSAAVSNLSSSLTVLRWSLGNTGCTTSTSTLSIYAAQPPSTASAGVSQTACLNTTTINASAPSIGTGSWTLISGSGTIQLPTSATTAVNNLGVGNNVFMWTISNAPCPSSSATLQVNHSGSITPANAGPDLNLCSTTATLSGNVPGTGTGQWSVITGSAIISQTANASASVSGLAYGTNVLRWTISNGACTPSSDDITIITTSVSPAVVGASQVLCAANANLNAVAPVSGVGAWSLIAGGGTITSTSSASTQVKGLIQGVNQFLWSITNAPCPVATATLTLLKNGTMSSADAGADQTICGNVTQLNASPVTIGTGSWSVISGSATIATPSNNLTQVAQLASGINVLRFTVTNGTCTPSSDDITIDSRTISAAVTGSDHIQCQTDYTLTAQVPQNGIGQWSVLSGTSQIAAPFNPTTTVTNLNNGMNVYRWTVTNAPCAPQFKDLAVLNCVNDPITAGAISGSPFCAGTGYAVSIQFTPNANYTGFYSAQLSNASGSFSNPINIGTSLSSPIAANIPTSTGPGNGYRIRIINSSPAFAGNDNGTDISINTCVTNALQVDSVSVGPYCLSTTYTLLVPFVMTGTVNGPFIAELSDLSGNFLLPITIGYGYSSPIVATIPQSMPLGSGYRIRVKSYTMGSERIPNAHNISINTCGITAISKQAPTDILAYPSPVNNVLHVQFRTGTPTTVYLTDVSGRRLSEATTDTGSVDFDMSGFEKGIYFVTIQYNGTDFVQKVIRE